MLRQYKSKFYLNASHYIITRGKQGETHSHCFEIIVTILPMENEEVRFFLLEQDVEKAIAPYQNKVLNDVAPFDTVVPTVENMCQVFSEVFCQEAIKNNVLVVSVQISETPTRSFIINTLEQDLPKAQEILPTITVDTQHTTPIRRKPIKSEQIKIQSVFEVKRVPSAKAYYTVSCNNRKIMDNHHKWDIAAQICDEVMKAGRDYWEFDI